MVRLNATNRDRGDRSPGKPKFFSKFVAVRIPDSTGVAMVSGPRVGRRRASPKATMINTPPGIVARLAVPDPRVRMRYPAAIMTPPDIKATGQASQKPLLTRRALIEASRIGIS